MKPMTFIELQEKLKRLDEITLIELLGISVEELVESFPEHIERHFERLEVELDD